jgi:hypothetical protein
MTFRYREVSAMNDPLRLAHKAAIAEIRDRGGRVNSIAPEELRKLIEAYVKEHGWEFAIEERIRV